MLQVYGVLKHHAGKNFPIHLPMSENVSLFDLLNDEEMIPEEYKILTNGGFFDRFDTIRGKNPSFSMVEIYNMVEDEFFELVGKNKYNGYDSFRNSRKYFNTRQQSK